MERERRMEIEAEVWCWTPGGMRRATDTVNAYVTVRDLERLLEEADERRRRFMLERPADAGSEKR